MTDSVLPSFGEWWRSDGERDGYGALLHANSSSTVYDRYALPRGDGRWTIEFEYSADAEAVVWLVVNRYSDTNVKLGEGAILDRRLLAAQNSRVVMDVEFPAKVDAKWLPSIMVRPGGADVKFNWVKVYETPAQKGPAVSVWDGARELPADYSAWDGAHKVPATVDIQA